jgi:group I intron endonuclease
MGGTAISAIVYQATNQVNGHRYIGFTTQGLAVREAQHRKDARSKKAGFRFHHAMRKYGQENFVFEVLFDFLDDEELAKVYEWEMISKHKPEYNLTAGGDGGSLHPETRAKISAATMGRPGSHTGKKFSAETRKKMGDVQRGRPSKLKGRTVSEEVRRKMSAGQMGHPGWNKGGTISEETKRKISEGHKGQIPWILGKTHSDETKQKIGAALKQAFATPSEKRIASLANNVLTAIAANKVPVKCITDGHIFNSSADADRFYGFCLGSVRKVVSGKREHTRGLVFIRCEDVK